MNWNDYIRMFIGLFAIMGPIGIIPLYLNFTENLKTKRTSIARTISIAVAVMGLLLSAMAIEFIVGGLRTLLPGLAGT